MTFCGANVCLWPTVAKRSILQTQGFPFLQCFTGRVRTRPATFISRIGTAPVSGSVIVPFQRYFPHNGQYPGGIARYYVEDDGVYEHGTGRQAFYIDGNVVHSLDGQKPSSSRRATQFWHL